MHSSRQGVWFITGSSTGFGRVLAEEVLKAGGSVAATARNAKQLEDLEREHPGRAKAIKLDVTDKGQVESAVAAAIAEFGRLDVVVNNAGYGLVGAIEEAGDNEIKQQIETNVYGVLQVTRAVLPQLRKQRSGHIVQMSSVAGLIGTAGFGLYNLTKFAVEGLSEALAAEVAPLGIKVTIVEPGPFRTDFAGRSASVARRVIEEYEGTAGKTRQYIATISGKQKGDPLRGVHAIFAAVESEKPPLHLLLGSVALERYREKLKQAETEVNAWAQETLSADFPENQ